MAPNSNIILCRHAQAEHNVEYDYDILDAPLTQLGKDQATTLSTQIPELQATIDLICTSPLTRTLQTTKLGFPSAIERLGIENVVCLPQAQGLFRTSAKVTSAEKRTECNAYPCDVGRPRETLESIKEFEGFNFERLTVDWTSKQGFYAADKPSLAKRARWVRQFLRDRKEENILLVAHGDILRQITASSTGPSTHMWRNAEVRVFKFEPTLVEGDECFLYQEADVAAAGGFARTSTQMPGGHL